MYFRLMKVAIYLILLTTLVGCSMFKPTIVDIEWWENRAETVATINHVHYNPETVIRYSYDVNGKEYTDGSHFMVSRPFAEGTKYIVAYNTENPTEHRMLFYKPVLEESEGVRYTIGNTGKGVSTYYFKDSIKLEVISKGYEIQANGYYLNDNRRSMINEMNYTREDTEEKLFLVKYWTKNPLRNVMLLDKPIAPDENAQMIFENTDNAFQLKRKLKKAARRVGEDGIIFWAPRNHSKKEIRAMKTYLRKNKNEYNVKEIEIVDNDNIDILLKRYLANSDETISNIDKQEKRTRKYEEKENKINTNISGFNYNFHVNFGYLFLTDEMKSTFRRYFEVPMGVSVGYNNWVLNFHYFNVIGEIREPFEYQDVMYDNSFKILNLGLSAGYQFRISPRFTLTPMVGMISSRFTGFNIEDQQGDSYPNLRSRSAAFMLNLDFDALHEDRRSVHFRNGDKRRALALFNRLQVFYSNPDFNQGEAFSDGSYFMISLGFGVHWHGLKRN